MMQAAQRITVRLAERDGVAVYRLVFGLPALTQTGSTWQP
jgi:hypothetical protein